MGAKSKEGLNHFPVDIDIFEDGKILLAQEMIDPDGKLPFCRFCVPYVAIRILKEVYTNGYYKVWNHEICLKFVSEIGNGVTFKLMSEIVNNFFEVGFLSKEMFLKHNVITSHGIQKRWLSIMKNYRRTKKSIRPELLLLGDDEGNEKKPKKISSEENSLFATEMPISSEESAKTVGSYSASFSILNNKSNRITREDYNTTMYKYLNKEKGIFSEDIPISATETPISSEEIPITVAENKESATEFEEIVEDIPISSEEKSNAPWKTEKFIKMWRDYKLFRKQHHKFEFKSFLTEKHKLEELWKLAKGDETKAIDIIKEAIAGGWSGFWPQKQINNSNSNGNGKHGNNKAATGGSVKVHNAFSKFDAMHSSDGATK